MKNNELFAQFNIVERRDGSKGIILGTTLTHINGNGMICSILDYDKHTLRKKGYVSTDSEYDIMKITTVDEKVLFERVEWENVKKDTKVLVSDDGECWKKRYFYEYREVANESPYFTYSDGQTSWSQEDFPISWRYCKLAE